MEHTITVSFDPDTTTARMLYGIFGVIEDAGWSSEDLVWDDYGITVTVGEGEAEELRAYLHADKRTKDLDLTFTEEDW